MVKRSGPTNYQLQTLLEDLAPKTVESRFWKRVASDLKKPSRQRRVVNVYTIDKVARDGEIILVPGKVLSLGDITKKVTVAALQFSSQARDKITAAQGKVLTIRELFEQNPEGKNVRIVG